MARELRVSATVPLPDGVFEEADVLAKARPIVDRLKSEVAELGGAVEFEIVVPRPRTKAEEPALPLRAAAADRIAA